MDNQKSELIRTRVGKDYLIMKKIGSGAFGDVFLGINTVTKKEVAIKVEKVMSNHYSQLNNEFTIIQNLRMYCNPAVPMTTGNNPPNGAESAMNPSKQAILLGIPEVYQFVKDGERNFMVMELLGSSLEDLLTKCHGTFSLKTTLMLAMQMLGVIEAIHERGYLHRDIKPDNYLMGTKEHRHNVYLLDFGLAKKYIDSDNKHIPYREGKGLVGTARYASLNTHLGLEQSRRDDLESLAYVIVYFLKGTLPWMNQRATTKKEKYAKIKEIKMMTSFSSLCKGLPAELIEFFDYVRNLSFTQEPNYKFLVSLLQKIWTSYGFVYDYTYDWTIEEKTTMTVLTDKTGSNKQDKSGGYPNQNPANNTQPAKDSGNGGMATVDRNISKEVNFTNMTNQPSRVRFDDPQLNSFANSQPIDPRQQFNTRLSVAKPGRERPMQKVLEPDAEINLDY